MKNEKIQKLVLTGVFAALSYVIFTFLQFKIPLPGGDATSIHLGNAVCVLGALILGGFYGGLAGAIGMTIGDLLDPVYVVYAPKTFLLKLCIGLIAGLIATGWAASRTGPTGRPSANGFFWPRWAGFCSTPSSIPWWATCISCSSSESRRRRSPSPGISSPPASTRSFPPSYPWWSIWPCCLR